MSDGHDRDNIAGNTTRKQLEAVAPKLQCLSGLVLQESEPKSEISNTNAR